VILVKRSGLVLVAGALLVAACSSGGSSSGSSSTAGSGPASSSGASSSAGGSTTTGGSTTAGATTTAAANLPPCHVSALASASAPVTITFWYASGGQIGPALQKLTDAYNSSQTKVKVNLVDQQGTDDILAKYRTASVSDRPSLAQMSDTNLQLLADSKTIVPVQSCIDEERYDLADYADRAISYYTIQGALQGMPFNLSMPVLYYNKAAFRAAGLDPDKPPATLDELRDVSQKIVASGYSKFGMAFDTGPSSGGSWYIEQFRAKSDLLYADNQNGRAARATKVVFNDDTTVQQVTAIQKLVTDALAVNVGQNTDGTQDLLKLADPQEPAAMTNHTSASLSSVINVLNAGTFPSFKPEDLGIGPMPAPAGNGGLLVGGAALWIVKGKSDAETAATWDYVKYLTSATAQAQWAADTGYVPIRKSSLDQEPIKSLYSSDPRFAVAYQQLNSGAVTPATAGPVLGPQGEVRQATSEAMQAIFGGADVKSSLDTAAQKADAQIADYAKRTGTS
jgi:sn-glycerol 3-phosphate transport system substrate-binding protein